MYVPILKVKYSVIFINGFLKMLYDAVKIAIGVNT